MDQTDPKLTFALKRSSWENIFHVLKWCAPMELSIDEKAYQGQEGEHWSLGNFWAAVQHLQAQLEEHNRLTDLYTNEWPPLTADVVGIITRPCGLCSKDFKEGDVLAAIEIEPADSEEARKKSDGREYTAACDVVHKRCYERASHMVRFVEEDGK